MVHRTRRAALLSVCAVLVIAGIQTASAQFVPRVDCAAHGANGIVTVNGRTAVEFRVPNAGLTPLDRAQITARRLKPLAAGGWKSIQAKSVGPNRAQVMAGVHLICIATAADARANNTSAPALARAWAQRLRYLFSLPPITVAPAEVVVPANETRSVIVGGAVPGPLRTFDQNPAVATSAVDPARRAVVVSGNSVGRCAIGVECQGYRTSFVVNVKRYAGRLTSPGVAEVTGNPAPDWLLERVAAQVSTRTVSLEPGAVADFGKPRLPVTSLSQGERARILVPVRISGEGLIPLDLLAPVEIHNRLVAHKPASDLFYSNNPERVARYGTLFAGKLALDQRTRLLYHHQNMLGKRVRFVIELINAGSAPASVQTIGGISPPLVDTVVVGYMAGINFLRDYLNHVGQIHRVPPRSRLVVYADDLEAIRTASGIIDFRQLSGGDVYVRVQADVPRLGHLAEGGTAPINEADVPTHLSDHVYTAPVKQVEAKYVVGERWAFVRVGKHAIRDASDQRELFGNYGVLYEIRVRVENPTGDARRVTVVFEPTAGPASGIFVVGGKIVGTKIVVPPKEFQVASVHLEPGQARDLSILTMPLAGSAYPATITVRS